MVTVRVAALALLVALAGLLVPASAAAHGVSDTADVSLAQTLAGNELTVVIRRTPAVPGPLQVEVIAHRPVRPVELVASLGGERRVLALRTPGPQVTSLPVHEPGPHELVLHADGQRALLPFRVLTPRTPAWEVVAYGGFAVAGVALGGALLAAGLRRRGLAVTQAGVGTVALSAGIGTVALTAALTAAALSPAIPAPLPAGAAPTAAVDPAVGAAGRPYALAAVRTEPPAPLSGRELTLRLRLVDGSTGRPVDDLVAHHGALAHTVVTSDDARFFTHVHPVRTAAGELAVRLVAPRPGRYLVHAEFERSDSGAQLVSGEFTVTGAGGAGPTQGSGTAPAARPGIRTSPAHLVAGRASTVEVDTAAGDLQPWLGMAGHLVLRDGSGRFFAHVHEMASMAPPAPAAPVPDETVAFYGPTLRFTFTFPAPGRYLGWVQYMRDYRIHTVPVVFDVAGAP